MLARLKDVWSGTEMLVGIAQSGSIRAAALSIFLLVQGPYSHLPVALLLDTRLAFLHAAVLGFTDWFQRGTSVAVTEPDWCGPQRNRAFFLDL